MPEEKDPYKGVGDGLASLGSAITSPAKLAFVGYVVLAYAGRIGTSSTAILIIAVVFFAFQVFHDDYLRIRLNECAKLKAKKARRRAFPADYNETEA